MVIDSNTISIQTLPAVSFVAIHCFSKSYMRSVVTPKMVRVIESKAFMKIGKLEKVVFEPGSSIVSVVPRCFAKCHSLSRDSFHDVRSLRTFSEELVMWSNLASFCVPNSVTTLSLSGTSIIITIFHGYFC